MPTDLQFDRSVALYESFLEPGLICTVLFFALFAAFVYKLRKQISPIILFFLSWIFIELIPVCQILFSIGVQPGRISTAEHFIYLSCVGIFFLVVCLFDQLHRCNKRKKIVSNKIFNILVALLLAFYFLMTVGQNIYSSNEIAMLERSLDHSPTNVRVRNSLAFVYARLNKFKEAEKHFRKTLSVLPEDGWALIGLGKSLCDQGKFWEGIRVYERIKDAGGLSHVHKDNLKATYALLKNKYEAMLKEGRRDYKLHYSLGVVYSKTGEIEQSIEQYKLSIKQNPRFKNSLFNLGSLLEATGDLKEAAKVFEDMVALGSPKDDMDENVYIRLSRIYAALGDEEKQ